MTQRLTRQEQQERTRQRLLDAAGAVFMRSGYLAASVDRIAAEAGYTRGAVYKNFGGKEGLWLAIVEHQQCDHLAAVAEAFAAVDSRADLIAALVEITAESTREPASRWSVASLEFLAASIGRPEVAAPLYRRLDTQVGELLGATMKRLGIPSALPMPDLVAGLVSLGSGLSMRRLVDPGLDVAGIAEATIAGLLPEVTT
ncbi:TetR/AcrR family transcriptional regulator [Stackebrandtia endophytica]|nr:TetR/AcrR family transcriptional regulator [Stackebrandtia endophytica]